jgi:hypothetical protein
MVTEYRKLTRGNLGFRYTGTWQREEEVGVIIELIPGPEPHVKLELPDGTAYIYDYADIGDAGRPVPCQASAIVKQLSPGVEVNHAHREWPVKAMTEGGWALAQDPWAGRWHWLPPRTAGRDHIYCFDVAPLTKCQCGNPHLQHYQVAMQSRLLLP